MHASLTFGAAFVGGLASFLSPCVLPLLPTLLLLLAGSGTGRKSRLGVNLTAFLLGFAVVFMALGAASTLVGRLLLGHLAFWEKLGGILLVLLGLFLSGLWQPLFLVRDRRPFLQTQAKGPLGCFLLGLSFTLGWTPCTGPILAASLLLAGHEATVGAGLLLLGMYTLGFALPFFLLALVWNQVAPRIRPLYRYLPLLQKAAGIFLLVLGLALFFGYALRLNAFLLRL